MISPRIEPLPSLAGGKMEEGVSVASRRLCEIVHTIRRLLGAVYGFLRALLLGLFGGAPVRRIGAFFFVNGPRFASRVPRSDKYHKPNAQTSLFRGPNILSPRCNIYHNGQILQLSRVNDSQCIQVGAEYLLRRTAALPRRVDGRDTSRAPAVNRRRAMLQKLSEEIRECLLRAEECKRLSMTPSAIKDYLDMEQRWLNLARSYEFTESVFREHRSRTASCTRPGLPPARSGIDYSHLA